MKKLQKRGLTNHFFKVYNAGCEGKGVFEYQYSETLFLLQQNIVLKTKASLRITIS